MATAGDDHAIAFLAYNRERYLRTARVQLKSCTASSITPAACARSFATSF
jgi:hypothetical protein